MNQPQGRFVISVPENAQQGRYAITIPEQAPSRAERVEQAYPGLEGVDLGRASDREIAAAGAPVPPGFFEQTLSFGTFDNVLSGMDAANQGVRNVARRIQGEPIERTMGEAYRETIDARSEILDQRRAAQPVRSTALTLAGGLMTGGASSGAAAARPLAASLLNRSKEAAMTVARGAGVGGLAAGAYSAAEADDIGESRLAAARDGFIPGAIAGGALSGLGVGVGALRGRPAPTDDIPEIDDLRAASQAAYEAVDNLGVRLTQDAAGDVVSRLAARAQQEGLRPQLHRQIATFLRSIRPDAKQELTLAQLDQVRRQLRGSVVGPAARSGDDDTARIGQAMIEELDDYISRLAPDQLAAGNADDAAAALSTARQAHSRYRKGELLQDAIGRAETRAGSTGTGGNVENATRQNLRRLLENPRTRNLWTPEEAAALRAVVMGDDVQNVARLIGRLSPEGNGLMAALGLGATTVNPALAVLPAAGMISRRLADGRQARNVALLEALVRTGQNPSASAAPAQLNAPLAAALLQEQQRQRITPLAATQSASPVRP